jgi:hypothetical protein
VFINNATLTSIGASTATMNLTIHNNNNTMLHSSPGLLYLSSSSYNNGTAMLPAAQLNVPVWLGDSLCH